MNSNVSAHLSNHGEVYEEEGYADNKNKDLVPHWCMKPLWKQVADCGDQALHTHKLGTNKTNNYSLSTDNVKG